MTKRLRSKRKSPKQPKVRAAASSAVSRREYAELVVRLGSMELQAQRNRAELDLHGARIAQLQEALESLIQAAQAAALSKDMAALPITPTPTVES